MTDIDKIIKKLRHRRQLFVFTSFLCTFVFIISIYVLIRPAHSMINNTEYSMTEHIHTDECYTIYNEPEKKFLACGYENYENIIHIHDSFCYNEKNILVCPLEEITHEHESSCYNDNGELICNAIVHQHNEDCFRISDGEEYRVLSCGIEKHSFTEACTENVTIYSPEETIHEHESSCYNDNGELICNAIVHQSDGDYSGVSDTEGFTISEYENEENCHTETCYELVTDLPPPENTNYNETETIFADDNSDDIPFSIVYQAVSINNTENSDSVDTSYALNLITENKLNSVILSYQSADGIWNTINDPTKNSYPVDKSYRFRFEYKDIDTEKLISDHDCKLIIPECIPHWLNVQQEGLIMYESQPVGKIKVINGNNESICKSIIIIFEKEFLEGQFNNNNLTLQGNFYILGNVLLDKLTNDNRGLLNVPLIEKKYIQFEDGNLFEKYGRLDIIKREMGVETGIDGDYIKYQLVLQSLSSDADIPNVRVEDIFTGNTINFVEEYVGVPVNSLSGEPSGKNPYEVIEYNDGTSYPDTEHGSISYDSKSRKMTWNVGTLTAGTTRYLTYYVKTTDYYMGSVSRGELVNHVDVFSNNTLKDEDEAVFIPQTSVSVSKKETKFNLDNYGKGYMTYEIKITGNKKNSYDLVNLRLHDYLVLRDITGNDIHNAKSVINFDPNDENCVISAVSNKNRTVSITHMEDKDLTNAAFDFNIDRLSPDETITITCTVKAENLYMYINGYCELSNHAEVFSENNPERENASNYLFAASSAKHTFTKYNWMRKLQGKDLTEEKNITIGNDVFTYSGEEIISEIPAEQTFTAPVGSKKYTVYLNEQGLWDLSSTNLSDSFTAGNGTEENEKDHIKYKGYLEIQQYDLKVNGSDAEVESAMNNTNPVKTVWLNIDGRKSFSFTPEQIGLADHEKCYAYRLIYYAVPVNTDGIGQVAIANEFYASGDIGVNGTYVNLLGLKVSVSGIIQGNVHYSTGKETWYYDYYDTENGYSTFGSLYWVIRLDGTIPAGLVLRDCADVHRPAENRAPIDKYEIKGIYRCSSDINPLSYDTYNKFIETEESNMTELTGEHYTNIINHADNGGNEKCEDSFSELDSYQSNSDYVYGEHIYRGQDNNTGKVLAVKIQNEISLDDNECIYIILKTNARFSFKGSGDAKDKSKVGNVRSVKIFENRLDVREYGTNTFVPASDGSLATYIHKYSGSAMKEGVAAYMREGNNWKLISTSENDQKNNTTLYNKGYWHKNDLDENGIYAEWILHVNWDGMLDGTVDVHDYLPEGFEPVHIDFNKYSFNNDYVSQTNKYTPELYTLPELDSSDSWKKVKFYCSDFDVKMKDTNGIVIQKDTDNYYSSINSPVYYNPENNEVRFRVGGLESITDEVRLRDSEISFVLICRITDPEILLKDYGSINSGEKYYNKMEIRQNGVLLSKDSSYIQIDTRGSIIKSFAEDNNSNTLAEDRTGSYESTSLYQQFKIIVNPLEYDLSTDSTGMFPPLVDKIDGNLTFLTEDENEIIGNNTVTHKGGLEIKYADGTSVDGYTVQFKKAENELVINNLPADKKIIITYWTKINASDLSQGIKIKNTAYWFGYSDESDSTLAQVDVTYNYDSGGEITFNQYPKINIVKADSSNLNKKLSGARFTLFRVNSDKSLTEIKSGITGDDGKLTFEASTDVEYDKLYCIKETEAPDGYKLDDTLYYFAIQNYKRIDNNPDGSKEFVYNNLDLYGINENLVDICYNSSAYYFTLLNDKILNKISVTKHFKNPEGQITCCEGEYKFGIYNSISDSPLQILSIIYDENGNSSYKLDNIPVDRPEFTCAEADMIYYIYELDNKNKPVHEGSYLTVNGSTYLVSYKSSSNIATVNDKYHNFDVTNNMVLIDMPETGGTGLKNYYICALLCSAFMLMMFALFRKIKS